MFTFEDIRRFQLDVRFPKGKSKVSIEDILGNVPLKSFYLKGSSNSAFFNLINDIAPRLDFNLGETDLSVFKEKMVVRIAKKEEDVQLVVGGHGPKEVDKVDPFSEMSLAKVSNDLNFLLGIAMSGFGKKGEPVKVEGAIWLSSSSAIPDITGLFSVSPEKVGLSKGKFTGLYVEFQDTMFDATADWTVMINIATKEER